MKRHRCCQEPALASRARRPSGLLFPSPLLSVDSGVRESYTTFVHLSILTGQQWRPKRPYQMSSGRAEELTRRASRERRRAARHARPSAPRISAVAARRCAPFTSTATFSYEVPLFSGCTAHWAFQSCPRQRALAASRSRTSGYGAPAGLYLLTGSYRADMDNILRDEARMPTVERLFRASVIISPSRPTRSWPEGARARRGACVPAIATRWLSPLALVGRGRTRRLEAVRPDVPSGRRDVSL